MGNLSWISGLGNSGFSHSFFLPRAVFLTFALAASLGLEKPSHRDIITFQVEENTFSGILSARCGPLVFIH